MSRHFVYGAVTDHAAILARYGLARGAFAREGIELEVKPVYGGPEMSAAVEAGIVHVGEVGTPPGITAIAGGARIRIIGSGLDRGLAFFLITRPDVASWDDFRGTTVAALSKGSCGYWYLRDILAQHGVDPDTEVTFRHLGAEFGRKLELLKSGEISGLLASEPAVSRGEAEGVARFWGGPQDVADVPSIQWSIQIAGEETLAREPTLVRDVLEIVAETGRHVAAEPEEWLRFYRDLHGLDEAVARRAIAREWPLLHFDGQLDIEGLERALDLQHRVGATSRRLGLDEVVDLRFQPAPRPLAKAG